MLKIAIAGCGKIADAHASQIKRIHGCEIVAACDREPLMARQLCDRFGIKRFFSDLSELVSEVRPDVVHILTPPETHFPLAQVCLERHCHVYVEKPFTLDTEEARGLVNLAEESGCKLTVGHNYQFSHAARRMRALVESGYLGGVPVHLESYYGYDLGDPSYARALLGDKHHWVRRLPGKLLQNIISHGISRIAEFLTCDNPKVIAHGFVSPFLTQMEETDIIDELRVVISDEKQTTAYFTFSSQMRPAIQEFRIYGPKNGLVLNQNHETLLRLRGPKFKSYADHFIPPVVSAAQHVGNLLGNVRLFLAKDFHMDSGLKCLIESFYQSIREGARLPIPYREIVLTARIMDSIFDQLSVASLERDGCSSHRTISVGTLSQP
jgi:predicted dehydrogenase